MALKLVGGPLRELRIHLCQKGKESEGVRNFIKQNYPAIKEANPKFPILIRECSGIQPRLWARYEKGVEKSVPLTGLQAGDILKEMQKLLVK